MESWGDISVGETENEDDQDDRASDTKSQAASVVTDADPSLGLMDTVTIDEDEERKDSETSEVTDGKAQTSRWTASSAFQGLLNSNSSTGQAKPSAAGAPAESKAKDSPTFASFQERFFKRSS